jgi:hypothetical protein
MSFKETHYQKNSFSLSNNSPAMPRGIYPRYTHHLGETGAGTATRVVGQGSLQAGHTVISNVVVLRQRSLEWSRCS